MKTKIKAYIIKQAKKYHFEEQSVIDDLIQTSSDSYDHFINRGYSMLESYQIVKRTIGDLHDLFRFSNRPAISYIRRQVIINILVVLSGIINVILSYLLGSPYLYIVIDLFTMMVLFVIFIFFTQDKKSSTFHKNSSILRHLYCIIVNLIIISPQFFNIKPEQYLQSVGLLSVLTNIGFIVFVSKEGMRALFITIPCSILSLLLWIENDHHLIFLYAIVVTIICSCIFLYFETYSNEPHHWVLVGITSIYFLMASQTPFPNWVINLVYGVASTLGCLAYHFKRSRPFRLYFDKINLHLSIFIYAFVFTNLIEPVVLIFKKAFTNQTILDIDYFHPLVWSTLMLCIDFIYYLCYHYIKEYQSKRTP